MKKLVIVMSVGLGSVLGYAQSEVHPQMAVIEAPSVPQFELGIRGGAGIAFYATKKSSGGDPLKDALQDLFRIISLGDKGALFSLGFEVSYHLGAGLYIEADPTYIFEGIVFAGPVTSPTAHMRDYFTMPLLVNWRPFSWYVTPYIGLGVQPYLLLHEENPNEIHRDHVLDGVVQLGIVIQTQSLLIKLIEWRVGYDFLAQKMGEDSTLLFEDQSPITQTLSAGISYRF